MIVIVKYNAGNARSVENAVNRLGYKCIISNDAEVIQSADKVIFPGVGEASSAMEYLTKNGLDILIKSLQQPFLGICLGQQLMCSYSEEGNVDCLGIFNTKVKLFAPDQLVPHMGWNSMSNFKGELYKNFLTNSDVYFVHSYYAEICEHTTATCDYIVPFSASMQKDNFYSTQYHPEKSSEVGERILLNFLEL